MSSASVCIWLLRHCSGVRIEKPKKSSGFLFALDINIPLHPP